MIDGASVNVLDFGAVGDGVTDDSAAISAAIAYGVTNQTAVYFPAKIYKIATPVPLTGQVYLYGDGGFNKSCLVGHSTSIFTYASLDNCVFEKLSFSAAVAGCSAFKQTDLTVYTFTCVWRDCDFFYSLTECIYGNLQQATIERNTFGYHGPSAPSQTAHRHIYCKGDSAIGNTANINRIIDNKFYNASGVTESCYFESGYRLNVWGNVFETNTSRALTLAGMSDISILGNWFENNNSQFCIALTNNTLNSIGNYVVDINNNRFVNSVYSGGYVALVTGAGSISSFSYNTGTGLWYEVTPGNGRIVKADNNFFIGPTPVVPSTCRPSISGFDFIADDGYTVRANWTVGTGSPEGFVVASPGSLYSNLSGGASTTLYVKQSGTGNTGWVAK
jgi:hypothetical protein